jgi:hypothetical protein
MIPVNSGVGCRHHAGQSVHRPGLGHLTEGNLLPRPRSPPPSPSRTRAMLPEPCFTSAPLLGSSPFPYWCRRDGRGDNLGTPSLPGCQRCGAAIGCPGNDRSVIVVLLWPCCRGRLDGGAAGAATSAVMTTTPPTPLSSPRPPCELLYFSVSLLLAMVAWPLSHGIAVLYLMVLGTAVCCSSCPND